MDRDEKKKTRLRDWKLRRKNRNEDDSSDVTETDNNGDTNDNSENVYNNSESVYNKDEIEKKDTHNQH